MQLEDSPANPQPPDEQSAGPPMSRTRRWLRVLAVARVRRLHPPGGRAWVALPLLGLLLGLPTLLEPAWYDDEGIFAAVANDVRHGQTLYSEAWDTKPPFIFWTYAAIQAVAGTGMVPLRVAGLAATAGTIAAACLVVSALGFPRRSWVAGILVAAFLVTPVIEGNLVMTETFLALFAALAAIAFVRTATSSDPGRRLRGYLVAGLLLGIAANYKQVALWDAGAFFVMLLCLEQKPFRPAAMLVCGVLIPHAAVIGVMAVQGAAGDYWYAVAGALPRYRDYAPEPGTVMWAARFVPLAMATAYVAGRRLRGGPVGIVWFAPLWASAALAGALSSTYPYPHYLQQVVVPGAVALSLVALPRGSAQVAFAGACGVALVAGAVVIHSQFSPAYRSGNMLDPRHYYETALGRLTGRIDRLEYTARFDGRVIEVDELLAQMDTDRETLFAWHDMPWVYARSGFSNPTRFVVSYMESYFDDGRQEIMRQLEAAPPDYLILADPPLRPFPELEEFAQARYDPVASGDGWRLYELAPGHSRVQ